MATPAVSPGRPSLLLSSYKPPASAFAEATADRPPGDAVVVVVSPVVERKVMPRPNLLFILTDQQRHDTMGCYGNRQIFTPSLDRLAASGVVFERAYTSSPECVPARSVMMTGLSPHRSGVFSNGSRQSVQTPTFQRLLRDAGYLTQAIGKMHFVPSREGFGMERLCLSEEIPGTVEEDEFLTDLVAAGFGHAEEPHGMRSHMYYVP